MYEVSPAGVASQVPDYMTTESAVPVVAVNQQAQEVLDQGNAQSSMPDEDKSGQPSR